MHYYLHFAFIFRPFSPNEINLELVMQTSELYPVRRTCVVVSVSCPSPNYGVLHFWRQLHILEPGALEGEKFLYLHRCCDSRPEESDPITIL
jgi:hypothetical protein